MGLSRLFIKQTNPSKPFFHLDSKRARALKKEVKQLVDKKKTWTSLGAKENGFSVLVCGSQGRDSWHPVINVTSLNTYLVLHCYKMEGIRVVNILSQNRMLKLSVKDVEEMHFPQFAQAHKTQHVTTTRVGTLNILEHSFSIYLFIYSHLSLYWSLVHSLLLSISTSQGMRGGNWIPKPRSAFSWGTVPQGRATIFMTRRHEVSFIVVMLSSTNPQGDMDVKRRNISSR